MGSQSEIVVRGAREHNLRGIDVSIPRGSLTTITGVSGSGKSSLAFDTIFQEGQRRFVESLSSYARQFLGQNDKPKVDHIEGLSPTVSIDQKSQNRNPRSTVGTITEVHDHLRLLFARLGEPHCPKCDGLITAQSPEQVADRILKTYAGCTVSILAPIVKDRKGEYRKELGELLQKGYVRARIDGEVRRLDEPITLHRYERHTIEVILDRVKVPAADDLGSQAEKRGRLHESVEQAFKLGDGEIGLLEGERHEAFSSRLACAACGIDLPEMEPRTFSFNSPHGACPTCDGLGDARDIDSRMVVPDQRKTIAGGAIVPSQKPGFSLRNHLSIDILKQICEHFGVASDVPFKKLPAKDRTLLLEGSKGREVPIEIRHESKKMRFEKRTKGPWEGVLPILRRLYKKDRSEIYEPYLSTVRCPDCQGFRLRRESLAVKFRDRNLGELSALPIDELISFLDGVVLVGREIEIGTRLFKELLARLRFLSKVGLGYLSVLRSAASLSGGESQRIRLATQVGSRLRGVLYVLDEPSIGLHQRDNAKLIETLFDLRDAGNTVLVVEHDQETMEASDHIVDIGPGAGEEGGLLVAEGRYEDILNSANSLTGSFLSGREVLPGSRLRPRNDRRILCVKDARENNLQGVDVEFPLGLFTCVTGVSGSGKSTLVDGILKRALAQHFHGAEDPPGAHAGIDGLEELDKVIEIDQAPIGRTPRSNPATYTKVFDLIRDLFASLPESEVRGYKKGRFSFNVEGGRCEECKGAGARLIEMQFLSDVTVTCERCNGRRFNAETLEIHYRSKSINDVLEMTIREALEFFEAHPKIKRALDTLARVGLTYVRLGQPSTTLSGGEAQRVKLAAELHRPATGRTLYILDEPTTGLHFVDIRRLIGALQDLVDAGNTVVVIEHNLDVVKCADWVIDLGPEGGNAGGRLVYDGTVEGLLACEESRTGQVLKEHLDPKRERRIRPAASVKDRALDGDIVIKGARLNNLKGVTARFPAGSLSVVTGPSGSGKTSLAFDTLFAEGQRRFVECLSTYARQFLGRVERPPIDAIEGLAPAIAIDQKNTGRNPRSTVATTTEIHDYFRLMFARVGTPHCPSCGAEIQGFPPGAAVQKLLSENEGRKARILAPLLTKELGKSRGLSKATELKRLAKGLVEAGFVRVLIDGAEVRLDEPLPPLGKTKELWLVLDRVVLKSENRVRLLDSVAQAYERGHGMMAVEVVEGPRVLLSETPACVPCGFFMPEALNPKMFSFNSLAGACESCHGLGISESCDPDRLIVDPTKPLFEGALVARPGDFLSRRGEYFRAAVEGLATSYRVLLSKPWKDLPKSFRSAVMSGETDLVKVSFQGGSEHSNHSAEMSITWKGYCRYIEDWQRNPSKEWWAEILEPLMRRDVCGECQGDRLSKVARKVTVKGQTLGNLGRMTVSEAKAWFKAVSFDGAHAKITEVVLPEIQSRLGFLDAVGLEYLSLGRSAATLSGGEAQRIRLATQIGNRLTGVIYVLDEPTIGLHPRDTERLLSTLTSLRDLGNTLVVVEHDRDTIDCADWVVDLGPGAGHLGGEVVFQGSRAALESANTLTADYLASRREVASLLPTPRVARGLIRLEGVAQNNIQGLDVAIPTGQLVVVTGVSGSGKSSLVMDTLAPAATAKLQGSREKAPLRRLSGLEEFTGCVIVDQAPIGTSPKSNPVSYIGVFDDIRSMMTEAPLAKVRGYGPGHFSFNTSDGCCFSCDGRGSVLVEMHFLPDVWVLCDSCKGKRYNREVLAVEYRGKSIADILAMEVSEAVGFFESRRRVVTALRLLEEVGLGYMRLGQPATTLSGGEAQRIKLAAELAHKFKGPVLYLLDEPTTGLHFDDVAKLIRVLHRLVENGHSVVVIEHNEDVIRSADWVIDLGPEGGAGGGRLVFEGTPTELLNSEISHTGRHLKKYIEKHEHRDRAVAAGGRHTVETCG